MTSDSDGGRIRNSIAPWLSVRRSAAEVYRLDGSRWGVVARLSVDGAEFWLSDESPEHGNFSAETVGWACVRMILTVADPDGVFAQAVKAGA